ncbi:MAG: hypothetical protein ACXAC5_04135 [Promethearchaeota archaeon]
MSEETFKDYHNNGRLYVDRRKAHLINGGLYEESRIYRDSGKLLSLSQNVKYKDSAGKDTYIRYTDWSDLGHRRMDFAAHNNQSMYFKYYPAYYNESSSSANINTLNDTPKRESHVEWWCNQIGIKR